MVRQIHDVKGIDMGNGVIRYKAEVDVDGRKYSPTCKRPGAPRRALTVWDAISDLPPIRSGHDAPVARFQEPPRTHLQQLFRAGYRCPEELHFIKFNLM